MVQSTTLSFEIGTEWEHGDRAKASRGSSGRPQNLERIRLADEHLIQRSRTRIGSPLHANLTMLSSCISFHRRPLVLRSFAHTALCLRHQCTIIYRDFQRGRSGRLVNKIRSGRPHAYPVRKSELHVFALFDEEASHSGAIRAPSRLSLQLLQLPCRLPGCLLTVRGQSCRLYIHHQFAVSSALGIQSSYAPRASLLRRYIPRTIAVAQQLIQNWRIVCVTAYEAGWSVNPIAGPYVVVIEV